MYVFHSLHIASFHSISFSIPGFITCCYMTIQYGSHDHVYSMDHLSYWHSTFSIIITLILPSVGESLNNFTDTISINDSTYSDHVITSTCHVSTYLFLGGACVASTLWMFVLVSIVQLYTCTHQNQLSFLLSTITSSTSCMPIYGITLSTNSTPPTMSTLAASAPCMASSWIQTW